MQTASWARRIGALFVDWFASMAVVVSFGGLAALDHYPLAVHGVFWVESAFLTAVAGGSFGKLATRLRTVRLEDAGPVSLLRALLRQALVLLVIPPLVFRPDGRGLHDLVAGSVTAPVAEVTGSRG